MNNTPSVAFGDSSLGEGAFRLDPSSLSEAKDLEQLCDYEILRYAQNDKVWKSLPAEGGGFCVAKDRGRENVLIKPFLTTSQSPTVTAPLTRGAENRLFRQNE